MNAKKDRIAETERVKERKRARVERGAGDVLEELGDTDDEQVAVRHADVKVQTSELEALLECCCSMKMTRQTGRTQSGRRR